ncbi:hypothetical protein ACOMHN_032068 [Nucella lapillus]
MSSLCPPDTLGSSEDGLDTLASDEELREEGGETCTTTTTTTTHSAAACGLISSLTNTATATTHTSTRQLADDTEGLPTDTDDTEDLIPTDTDSDTFFHRPKSHSVIAATYLSRPKLSGGDSTYSDILNNNVRLWKDRLEHAHSVRHRVSILEEESQEV